jgi:hypothetical protein
MGSHTWDLEIINRTECNKCSNINITFSMIARAGQQEKTTTYSGPKDSGGQAMGITPRNCLRTAGFKPASVQHIFIE